MRILFLTDNFPPEVNAPATRTFEHCQEWVKAGAEVTIITGEPNFPQGKVYAGYKNQFYKKETINGIKVIRVWTYIVPNKGILKRTLDFISFSITSFFAGLFQKADIIIATSPQFFTALSARTLHFWKHTPWIMEVRDLWPESIKTVGAIKQGKIIRYWEWQEERCYNSAKKIVVVTDTFKKKLIERGFPENKIEVIKNGVNLDLFKPIRKDQELLDKLGLRDKKIIGYIGTHGMAHKLDFILRCAKNMENQTEFHFLFLGDGGNKEELLKLKEELKCTNVTMLPSVSKKDVKHYISILDICLINLRKDPLFTTVIPSKIFENAAMAIPILMGVEGEAQEIVESYGAGLCFEPENEDDFKKKLSQLIVPNTYKQCQAGCLKLAADFNRKKLARRMLKIIENTVEK
ncbi:glycosyltransferase family 4 protein [Alloprevotella rava]|uniref:Glycosyltransferase involved in cell wall biosynthesis n=1 Tax=Alloprevotella rava TaxID=671218 RepID=A0A7W5UF39_9BACT|nr:glycosyltransferase family 4 protein [Alloprevotella rava]MBB3702948.1 glycosyltransferase involved in cell wall biosynthesis [Alloprevotella rava]